MATTRGFRVFVSSTFEDFAREREALDGIVAPELRLFCQARGVDFQLVDLRWGVNSLSARGHRTLAICLNEIDKTLILATKPSFLVLLGDRYGWRPLPRHLQAELFDRITAALDAVDAGAARRLSLAYRLDENALPPRRELILAADHDEEPVREALRHGLALAGLSDSSDVRRFFWSATHHEVERGALSEDLPHDHVVACFRTLKGGSLSRAGAEPLDEHSEGTQAALSELRDRVRRAAGRVHDFVATVRNGEVDDEYLKTFAAQVTETLKSLVLAQLQSAPPATEAIEGAEHEARGQMLADAFVARTDERAQLPAKLSSLEGRAALLVTGPGGSGKTTLMARAALDLRRGRPEAIVVERFVGTTPGSTRAFSLVVGVAQQIRQLTGLASPPVPAATLGEAVQQLQQVLRLATRQQPVALFLDALDQLDDRDVDWLPTLILPRVTLVWSVLSPSSLVDSRADPENTISLGRLSTQESSAILDARLRAARRTMSGEQREKVTPAVERAGSPLFVEVAFHLVRTWRSWDAGFALPEALDELLDAFLERLTTRDHGRVLVDHSLALLAASRHGLSETELLALLSADTVVMDEFRRLNPYSPVTNQLPPIVWSRLRAAIEAVLAVRGAQGTRLYAFFHRAIADYASRRFLSDNFGTYAALADYFDNQPMTIRDTGGTAARLNARKLSELPAACVRSGRWNRVTALLNDFAFLMAKCEVRLSEELVADVEDASRSPAADALQEVTAFMARHGVDLRGDNDVWPAHRVLLQIAIDQLPDSPLQARAQAFLESGAYNGLWLRPAWPAVPDGVICRVDVGAPIVNVEEENDEQIIVTLNGDRRRRWSRRTGLALGDTPTSSTSPALAIERTPPASGDVKNERLMLDDGWQASIDSVDVLMQRSGAERLTIERTGTSESNVAREESTPFLSASDRRIRFGLGSRRHKLRRLSPHRWAIWDEEGRLSIWDLDRSIKAGASRAQLPEMATTRVAALHRLTNLSAVSCGLHHEFDARISFWDCQTGARVETATLPDPPDPATSATRSLTKKWITGCMSLNGLAIAWGPGATLGIWHPASSKPLAYCVIDGEFDILAAEPFWYSITQKAGVAASKRARQPGEHLIIAILTSRGSNVLFDATLMTGIRVYQSTPTRSPEYARRYEMFGFDLLADGKLARRYCDDYPQVYDLGPTFAAPTAYQPVVLQGNWQPTRATQNPSWQVRQTSVLTDGQFVTLRGNEVVIYQADGTRSRIWKGRGLFQLPDRRLLIFSADGHGCGTICALDDSTAPLSLAASSSPIGGAASLTDGHVLTWHDDEVFRKWDATTGELTDSCPQADAWYRRPEWIEAWVASTEGPIQCMGWRAWQSPSMLGLVDPTASGPVFASWYSGIDSKPLWIEPDGTLVLLRDVTEPRVLHLWRGNARVDLSAALDASPESRHGATAPIAASLLAEACLTTSDLLVHLTRDRNGLDCRRAALDAALRFLSKPGDNEVDDIHIRTYTECALLEVEQGNPGKALVELHVPPLKEQSVDPAGSLVRLRHRCLYATLLLIAHYRDRQDDAADAIAERGRVLDALGKDIVPELDTVLDRCDSDRKRERHIFSIGLGLAILFRRHQAGDAVAPAEIEEWRALRHTVEARHELEASLNPTTGLLGASRIGHVDLAWLGAHVVGREIAAQPQAAVDVPVAHPAADPDRAAALNLEYQKALAAWRAMSWFQRLRTRKPIPPSGI
jgi:hypothetical protein